jgi:hypothetical protein
MAKKERVSDVRHEEDDEEGMGFTENPPTKDFVLGWFTSILGLLVTQYDLTEDFIFKYIHNCMCGWGVLKIETRRIGKENKRTITISPRGKSSSLGERQTGTPRKVRAAKKTT